ncbi:3-hydroxyacyl-CoA dehydrogenase NAD-binding domain-containing protein [Staphylococcus pseudoxylosus]|uniref:3-hydroxyacyl-CoA dehydrogenase family protein n=1 Tax=Staphylococcus pseudoxylosus TaxID=2282419 RepID=UPI00398B917B
MENITIIGSGTMGHSIALSTAWAGYKTQVYSLNDSDLDLAKKEIENKLDDLYSSELITEKQLREIKKDIILSTNLEKTVEYATFVIEATPEDLEIKKEVYTRLAGLLDENIILASNTSGFTLNQLSQFYTFPENFIITHFWNPAHLIPLVEIVKNDVTRPSVVNRTTNLIETIGKKPILIQKEIPGFIGNRLQYALFREAQSLLDKGVASKEDIDAAVTYSVGRRYPIIGPLMTADLGGLDTFSAISNYLFEDLNTDKFSGKTLARHVQSGELGYKTGKGFYNWDGNPTQEIINKRDEILMYFLKRDLEEK